MYGIWQPGNTGKYWDYVWESYGITAIIWDYVWDYVWVWDDEIPNMCKNRFHVPNHQPV